MFPEPERRLRLLAGELQGDEGGAVGGEEAGDGVAGNADAAPAAGAEGGEAHRGALVELGIGGDAEAQGLVHLVDGAGEAGAVDVDAAVRGVARVLVHLADGRLVEEPRHEVAVVVVVLVELQQVVVDAHAVLVAHVHHGVLKAVVAGVAAGGLGPQRAVAGVQLPPPRLEPVVVDGQPADDLVEQVAVGGVAPALRRWGAGGATG